MRIILDVDGTITNTDKAVVELYREITGDKATDYKNNDAWSYDKICPLWTREEQNRAFINPRLFELMKPFDRAAEIISKLKSEGHEVIIATIHNPKGVQFKSELLKRIVPCVDTVIYIDTFSSNGTNFKMDKSFIYGDVIVDDNLSNLKTSPCKYKLCYGNYAYNSSWDGDRAANWNEVYSYVKSLKNDNYKQISI